MTNTPDKSELLPCRECGAPCSPELFPVHCGEPCDTTIWMCSQHRFLGGKCPSETAYLTKTAWNTRASPRPADQVPDMVERVARALKECGRRASIGMSDCIWTDFATAAIAALQAVPAMGEVGMQNQLLIAIAEHAVAGTFDQKQEAAGNVRRTIAALQASGEE